MPSFVSTRCEAPLRWVVDAQTEVSPTTSNACCSRAALPSVAKQAVKLYLDGRIPEVGTSGRPIDASRDAIVLCTDHSAPATVREDLDELFAELPPSRPGKPSRKGTQVEPDAVCVRDGSTYTSEHLNVSPRHLPRLFREELSTTPARYVESIRCDVAKGMLDQGYTATQAAARAGFPATRARAGSSRARCTCHKRPISVASVRRAVTWNPTA